MDIDSASNLGEAPSCALCHTILSSENVGGDLEAISVCGDCNFLLLEDFETSSPRRRGVSRRRFRFDSSSQSMDSHQFSRIINLARQNPSNLFERDLHSVDGDDAARSVRRSGSRRWRRVLSDTESEGFDSVNGESESNASFRRYRAFHGEADAISYSVYGGESDASVDGQSFLGIDIFGHPNGESEVEDSDNDIDPMNAGTFQWNSEDDSDWEEAESIMAAAAQPQPHGVGGSNVFIGQLLSPEVFPRSIRQRIQAASGELLTSLEESLAQNYAGDYLDARGFEDLLEHLAENDNESWRRGAPPASVSYINSMPCVTVDENNVESSSMVCAICKDSYIVGTVVNQLPCFHLYHPACILPWLSARNTCPLCRYELPTDDKETNDVHEHDSNEDDDSSVDEEASQVDFGREQREVVDGNGAGDEPSFRNRWFFLAAPIVSIVSISLVLWFGNSSSGSSRLCLSGRAPCRRDNNHRRWWSLF